MTSLNTKSNSTTITNTPRKRKIVNKPIIAPNSSDIYFQYQSIPAKVSNNVFPYPPLTAKETKETLSKCPVKLTVPIEYHRRRWLQWKAELFLLGRSLIFTGTGSKYKALNDFANNLSNEFNILTIDGFNPSISLREILTEIQSIDKQQEQSQSLEDMAKSVIDRYSSSKQNKLIILIHNFDSVNLRSKKVLDTLKQIIGSMQIHVIASVDHLTAPILFPVHDSTIGLNWIWHDLTTFEPYTLELSYRATTSILQGTSGNSNGIIPTLAGAQHVLASVPDRARRLFIAISKQQLSSQFEINSSSSSSSTPSYSCSRQLLIQMAKQEFIATSEDAFEASLAEFRDHGLIATSNTPPPQSESNGPEQWLWIPLDLRSLKKVIESVDE